MNGYLQKQQAAIEMALRAGQYTGRQQIIDMLTVTANSKKFMNDDPFGETRILRLIKGIEENLEFFEKAWAKDPEADYMREKLDETLRQILPGQKIPKFIERYEYMKEIKYRRGK